MVGEEHPTSLRSVLLHFILPERRHGEEHPDVPCIREPQPNRDRAGISSAEQREDQVIAHGSEVGDLFESMKEGHPAVSHEAAARNDGRVRVSHREAVQGGTEGFSTNMQSILECSGFGIGS